MSSIRREERFAFAVAERVLGVVVDPYDVDGRQRAVDAMVRYPDGHVAALEVSSIGPQDEARIMGFLADRGHRRSVAGLTRRWVVELPRTFHPADISKVEEALRICEALGAKHLPGVTGLSRDLNDLLARGLRANALPGQSNGHDDGQSPVWFMLPPMGGFTKEALASLPTELAGHLASPLMRSKLDKLAATGLQERHLVPIVRPSAFSYAVFDGLAFGGPLPQSAPCLPSDLKQVWLITGVREGGVVRGLADTGWTRDNPYDDMGHDLVA